MAADEFKLDLGGVLEAACIAVLAEIARQRGVRKTFPGTAGRGRGPATRVVPTSDTCSKAARAAVVDLARNGVKVSVDG
jgi:hypothetical protein